MATKTGLLNRKTVQRLAGSVAIVNELELFAVVLEAMKHSPQFSMPLLQRNTFLEDVLHDQETKETLCKLVCCFATEYSRLILDVTSVPANISYSTFQIR